MYWCPSNRHIFLVHEAVEHYGKLESRSKCDCDAATFQNSRRAPRLQLLRNHLFNTMYSSASSIAYFYMKNISHS